jgi:hypothetical protein
MPDPSTVPLPWADLDAIEFEGNYPSEADRQRLLDEHYFQRACQVFMGTLPLVNMVAMRNGSEAKFGSGYNVLPIWKQRMDARCRVPTPNADVIYAMSYLDLRADGPLVVQAPPGMMGMLSDVWQRPLSDVGFAGPDKGQGGQYLVVPPHYDGPPLPGGYHTLHSSTYNVFLFWRAFLKAGPEGPDPSDGVAALEQTVIFPLRNTNPATWKPMEFPDASGIDVEMLFPRDGTYFDLLADIVEDEPVDSADMYVRGLMASIGIVKGEPFEPQPRLRAILDRAGRVAPKIIGAVNATITSFPMREYYTGTPRRRWINGFAGIDENFTSSSYLNVDQRMTFFLTAYSSSPAMAAMMVGGGAKYPGTFWDADGDYLSGEHSYQFHLPPNPPAR